MKKIKLFWFIFWLLFLLGFSFWYDYRFHSVEYFDINNHYQNYIVNWWSSSADTTFLSANWWTFSPLTSYRYTWARYLWDNSFFNPSNYELSTVPQFWNFMLEVSPYFYIQNNGVSLIYSSKHNWSVLFSFSAWVNSNQYAYLNSGSFIRVQVNNLLSSSSINPITTFSPLESFRTFVFYPDFVYDSIRWEVYDTTSNWVRYQRWTLSPWVSDEYSFSISYNEISSWEDYIDLNNVPYFFRTMIPTYSWSSAGWLYLVNKNIYVIKLNTLYERSVNTSWDFKILVLSLTSGSLNSSNLDVVYSRYSCPSESFTMLECVFLDWWYVRPNSLSNSFTSYNWSLINLSWTSSDSDFLRFMLSPSSEWYMSRNYEGASRSFNIYSVESSNIIQLYRPQYSKDRYSKWSYWVSNHSFGLSQSDWIDILWHLYDWDYNWTWLLNFSACINTEVCTTSWSQTICTTQCISQTAYESWGYIWSDWTIYVVNAPLSFNDLKNPDLSFSDSYLDSWWILDPVYFEDLFDPTKKAIWVCPFPYYSWPLDFLSEIWVDWVYFFMPVLCFYSAFRHWASLNIMNSDIIWDSVISSPLLSWDSENHQILFVFLDILLSIGLLGLFHHLSSLI